MKASLVLLLSVAETVFGGAILDRDACNADNCLRAVRATATSRLPIASSDCSSFLRTTVTPAVSTTTVSTTTTTTSTSTSTIVQTTYTIIGGGPTLKRDLGAAATIEARINSPEQLEKRALKLANPDPSRDGAVTLAVRQVTVVPSAVPTYASACSGAVRYSSACSCLGVTATTSVAPTPITTATTTFTSTATTTTTVQTTTTLGACAASDNYGFKYNGGYTVNGPGQSGLNAAFPSYPDITTIPGCCAKCYQSVGCLLFYLNGNTCSLYVESAGTTTYTPSNICPNGVANNYANTAGSPYFGLGPCNTYIGTP